MTTIGHDDTIQSLFAPIIGLPAWNVRKGHGSMLTMEFGEPRLDIREPLAATTASSPRVVEQLARRRVTPVGLWHLWLYGCDWRLLMNGSQTASSTDTDAILAQAAQSIDGQKLISLKPTSLRAPLGSCSTLAQPWRPDFRTTEMTSSGCSTGLREASSASLQTDE